MIYYEYRQNNPDGSFRYDEKRGISHFLFIEADSPEAADARAEKIGIIFDDERWHEANDWDATEDIPKANAVLVRNDNDKDSYQFKMMGKNEYETFIHPLKGDFYGAHKKTRHIKRKITGWGLTFTDRGHSGVIGVGDDGWDKSGDFSVPAPGYQYFRTDDEKFVTKTDTLRITKSDGIGWDFYSVWSSDKAVVEKIAANLDAYFATIPEMNMDSILNI